MNESVNEHITERSGTPPGGLPPSAALVVEDDPGIRDFMRFALSRHCTFVEVAETPAQADSLLARYRFDLLIVDIRLGQVSGLDWIQEQRARGDRTPVILMSEFMDELTSARAVGIAAAEVLPKPFAVDQLQVAVDHLLRRQGEPGPLTPDGGEHTAVPDSHGLELEGIVGQSEAMRSLMVLIRRIAGRSTTVLLEGESGTGKEVIARCLHQFSGRSGPFVPVNCGSISPELLESELFGHVKGAFTGAQQSREGLFSYASGGTLLLDEIAEMPLHMQAKLLRVLEERAIRPVGMEKEVPVDVRVLAATNRNMTEEVNRGNFREDLYYRLNVLALRLPSLRDRPSDIPHMVELFSRHLARELALPPLQIGEQEMRQLQQHDWPGNVRELKNVMERAMLLGQSPVQCLKQAYSVAPVSTGERVASHGYPGDMTLAEVEKDHILKVLAEADGNKSEAARRLGVSRKTLERKVKAWHTRAE